MPSLRIAITADPEIPVPPAHYGGIERIIHFLAEGLISRGHQVVLFAHRNSATQCQVVPYPALSSRSPVDVVRNTAAIAQYFIGHKFDVIHSFGRLAYLTPLALNAAKKLMSYQRPITPSSVYLARRIFGQSIEFTACSKHMIRSVESIGKWSVVYNGVPIA